ncbi:winged helix-turn-helix transcriptional regulator [Chitinophaga japonensis]|uniref:HxlR family transcriptional regulator n=1 Tax=Chitinophaga japonensis TaxID=104662 RepID=A0A562T6R5_CHIJA|nr:helix-turn-helix domain-containing protein [Chitinophaga japonensis]TWI89239.1 HxlR family transcriptional regulator [Chitinophaga japonensis]
MAARKKNSTYTRNEQCIIDCDLTYAVHKIGGRWKLLILDKLEGGKRRFGELKREFSYITERMLTLQLRALEQDGLVKRTVYAEVPPRVEYELTEMARELGPILKQLSQWGGKQRRLAKNEMK